MTQSPQTSVLRFQFPAFGAHKGSVLAESSAIDINGDTWNLMINISKSKCQRDGDSSSNVNHHLICMNLVLMRDVTSSVNTDDIKFSFVVRDEKGNVAHEEDFLPYGSTDDSSLMKVFNLKGANASDNGSILLNGTLVIDIVVHALPKE